MSSLLPRTAPNPAAVTRQLAIAAENGDCAALSSLLDSGGYSPQGPLNAAHAAAGQGHADCLRLLLARHPECVDFTTNAGWTLAHVAAQAGRADCLALLSKLGPIDSRDNAGWSPLHLAIRAAHPACIRILLARSADCEAPTDKGLTLVHLAAQAGDTLTLGHLLERGLPVDTSAADGSTPVHLAAACGHDDCLAILFEQGARHDAVCNKGLTPLELAAEGGHLACLRQLLSPPRLSSQKALAGAGRAAVHHKESAPFRLLLDYGADPHLTDAQGRNLAYWAAGAGAIEALTLLHERGADLRARDKDGKSPLHAAAQNGRIGCLDFLLKLGADPEENTEDGSTPMHLAADQGRGECMNRLIAAGARMFPVNRRNETPACLLLRTSGNTPLDCVWVHSRGAPPHHTMALYHLVLSASSEDLLRWAGKNRMRLGLITRWAKLDDEAWDALMRRPDFDDGNLPPPERAVGTFCLEDLFKNPNAPGVALRFFTQTPFATLREWAGNRLHRLASLSAHAPLDAKHGWELISHPAFPSRRSSFKSPAYSDGTVFDENSLRENPLAVRSVREFLTCTPSLALLSWAQKDNSDERLKLLVARAKIDEHAWHDLLFHPKFHTADFDEAGFDMDAARRNPHAPRSVHDFLVGTPPETLVLWAGNNVRRLGLLAAEARLTPPYWQRLIEHRSFDFSPELHPNHIWGRRRPGFDINTLLSNPYLDKATRKDLEMGLA